MSRIRSFPSDRMEFVTETIRHPSPVDVVEQTYGYLFKRQCITLQKLRCEGCAANCLSLDDHAPGCVRAKDVPDASTMHAAHIRISTQRLREASRMMLSVFDYDPEWATFHRCLDIVEAAKYEDCLEAS